uniref:Threonylcarbamoyl-AMP synthase n=1 Tax=Ananas comosus var. bracteatus TaxID=296719 RepID=A0A6V7NGZ8_ANACO|nr:unnamed protein product [Ananas comosus var. bracteatus]
MMNASVRTIEKFIPFPYSIKQISRRCSPVGGFPSLYQRRFLGSKLRRMSENSVRCDLGLQPKAECVFRHLMITLKKQLMRSKLGKLSRFQQILFMDSLAMHEAVNRIYEIKGRKHTSPLAICVADVPDISRFALVDHLPHGLLDSLLPGPVTVVLKRGESSILEKSLNPGLDSIGVRVPDFDFIRAIARGAKSALALTSANLRAYKILRNGSALEETTAILQKFGEETP